MKSCTILLVDDDISIRKFLRANLEARDYRVLIASNGEEAINILEQDMPSLIILDIMMPIVDGIQVCKRIREWSDIPIIMLSARDSENDKVLCLDSGADDYLTKPFSLKEMLSRIKAVLRRYKDKANYSYNIFRSGALEIDYNKRTVNFKGKDVNLTATEYKILVYLSLNVGRIVTSDQIIDKVWGEHYTGEKGLVQVNICRLRNKLGGRAKNNDLIITKPGIGYYMVNN
jgi:DNA-binding response OmpR family regulator